MAAGISPFNPQSAAFEAGRLVLEKVEDYVEQEATFGFETTMSGIGYVRRIKRMKANGYRIVMFYLKLPSADLAVSRVQRRVIEGGHDVPEGDVRRRFVKSWSNFTENYRPLADRWVVFDSMDGRATVIEQS